MSTFTDRSDPDGDDLARDWPLTDAEWEDFKRAQSALGNSATWAPIHNNAVFDALCDGSLDAHIQASGRAHRRDPAAEHEQMLAVVRRTAGR